MTRVLVLNSGSSSLKLQVVDTDRAVDDSALVTALVERIGEPVGALHVHRTAAAGDAADREAEGAYPDHASALRAVLEIAEDLGVHPSHLDVEAVGHRVVHGGTAFHEPVRVDAEVEAGIERMCALAPLHNPPNLEGIRVARDLLPDLPHVAVFDTGFFHTLPPEAYTYAIDVELARRWDLRRYGFHGTSHDYVSHRAAEIVGRPYDEVNQVVAHLGNGASMSAIRRGRAVDTSMGLTPLEGLVMGTRPGDVDPGLLLHLLQDQGMEPSEVSTLLNKASGLRGLSGRTDLREVMDAMDSGDDAARLAYDVMVHRLRRYLGGYWALLGELDTITFTAGAGENAARLRADVVATLGSWGVELDDDANSRGRGERVISAESSRVTVLVVPTNEELQIARACDAVLAR